MKALVCEMCGSNDMVKQDGLFVCQNCMTKYSVEEAKKMMIEIDNSKKDENLYVLARRAINAEDYKGAKEYYDQLLIDFPNDWEAMFYSAIGMLSDDASNCLRAINILRENILTIIDNAIESTDELEKRYDILNKIIDLSGVLFRNYKKAIYTQHLGFSDEYNALRKIEGFDYFQNVARQIKLNAKAGKLGEQEQWQILIEKDLMIRNEWRE